MIASESSVRDLMTEHIIKVSPEHSFTALCRLLFQLNIHHLPVVDKEEKLKSTFSPCRSLKTANWPGSLPHGM